MLRKRFCHFTSFIIAMALLLSAAPAKADLTIAPLRVVFKGRDRSAVVSLVNLASHVNTYRLSWTIYKVDETGKYATMPADPKNPFTVDKMVFFSPRQVTINPDQHQLVRLSLRRPADLPPGEYRGHLTFTRLPPDLSRRRKEDETKGKPKGQEIALNVNLSLSIPVIVRSGNDDELKVEISNPVFNRNANGQPTLDFDLKRLAGTFSTYGTIIVYWKRPGQDEQRIGVMSNVALYPEVKRRPLSIALNVPQISDGSVRVAYLGKYESQNTIWDEKILSVGK